MTVPLSPSERSKLARILSLLGSDKAGERDAAGLAAHRMITSVGTSWEQVLDPTPVDKPRELASWRVTCANLQKRQGDLRQWEKGFVADLPKFERISPKQRHVLSQIAQRVLGGVS